MKDMPHGSPRISAPTPGPIPYGFLFFLRAPLFFIFFFFFFTFHNFFSQSRYPKSLLLGLTEKTNEEEEEKLTRLTLFRSLFISIFGKGSSSALHNAREGRRQIDGGRGTPWLRTEQGVPREARKMSEKWQAREQERKLHKSLTIYEYSFPATLSHRQL